MLSIRTILHPTDFSERSEHAFHLACSLARDHGARVVLLHVVSIPVAAYEGVVLPPPIEEATEDAKRRLSQMEPAGIPVEHRVAEGDAAEMILRVAEEVHADLIVMGTHGRTGLSRLLMGSVAEQVVRRAPCPVLTTKSPFPADQPEGRQTEAGATVPVPV
jgi:nucleotide-binding universal stress UspA family protein